MYQVWKFQLDQYLSISSWLQKATLFSFLITTTPSSPVHIPGKEMAGTKRYAHSFRHTFCLFKKEITWRKEADLSLLLGTNRAMELYHIKDNCIDEIFMCTHYGKTLRFITKILCCLSEKAERV